MSYGFYVKFITTHSKINKYNWYFNSIEKEKTELFISTNDLEMHVFPINSIITAGGTFIQQTMGHVMCIKIYSIKAEINKFPINHTRHYQGHDMAK